MNEEKKRVRRSGAELIAAKKADLKKAIARDKAEKQARKAKIALKFMVILEKQLGRDLTPDDLPRLAAFLRTQDERGNFYKAAMERDFPGV